MKLNIGIGIVIAVIGVGGYFIHQAGKVDRASQAPGCRMKCCARPKPSTTTTESAPTLDSMPTMPNPNKEPVTE